MPSPASTAPSGSNGSGVCARTSSMKIVAKTMPASPIGMLIRKIQCQEMKVVMKPPRAGPISGPISAGRVTQTMALINSRRSTLRTRMRRATGVIIAPYRARAETVGGPATHRDEDREREQVGGDRELKRQWTRADIGGDRRERGGDDGRVHVLHEQGDRHDQRHNAFRQHKSAQRPGRACARAQVEEAPRAGGHRGCRMVECGAQVGHAAR